jgi:uncharacterized protein (DUF2267 family)
MVKAENHVPVFETTLQTTHEWLRELMGVALLPNQKEAYIVLPNVLHTLRDRLPAET